MIKEGSYWKDEDGNKWDANIYTEQQAESLRGWSNETDTNEHQNGNAAGGEVMIDEKKLKFAYSMLECIAINLIGGVAEGHQPSIEYYDAVNIAQEVIKGQLTAETDSLCNGMKAENEKTMKYVKICERAEKMGIQQSSRMTAMMDIESADRKFDLKLDEWASADDFEFAHDFCGIQNNVRRECFPATDFGMFVPRFAGR